ncbi:MAG: hypothetical protein WA160_08335 [Pseudobdellovibrio sp.]
MNTQVLNNILDSRWARPYTKELLNYYPGLHEQTVQYALYSQSIDRFFILDSLDLWTIHHTAKILSSKLSLVLCIFSSEKPPFTIENCLLWTLKNKAAVLPQHQSPVIYQIQNNDELLMAGIPIDFAENIKQLVQEQEFALFVLTVLYAARITELKLSLIPSIHNDSHSFYLDFFSTELVNTPLEARANKTIWPRGFLNEIGRILYRCQNVGMSLKSLSALKESITQTSDIYSKRISTYYFKTFEELLGEIKYEP